MISGILISIIGVLFGINVTLTGNVVGNSVVSQAGSFLGIMFFILGLLIAVSGDALQERLGQMEKENPSPSLQGVEQTAQEKRHFFWRNLFSKIGLGVRKKKREDEKYVKSNDDLNSDLTGVYGPHTSFPGGGILSKRYSEEENRRSKKRVQESEMEQMRRFRNNEKGFYEGINPAFKKVKKDLEILKWDPSVRRDDIEETLEKIAKIYGKWKIPFNKERYQELFDKLGIKGAGDVLDSINEFVISNSRPVSYDAIDSSVNSAARWAHFGRRGLVYGAHDKILKGMLETYANEAKTVPVSEVLEKYNVRIVHGIPFFFDEHRGVPPQFSNNAFWKEKMANGGVGNLKLEDFLENIFEHRPDLSTSAINNNSQNRNLFSPYGIVIKEGKIYDVAPHDLASQGELRKELVKMRLSSPFGGKDIDERVRQVATSTNMGEHNEVIIGDNYEIGGIYFTEKHHGWDYISRKEGERGYDEKVSYHKGTVARLAKQAIERNVPFYKFSTGKGFEEVNPREYLEEKVKEERQKYVTESRRVAQGARKSSRKGSRKLAEA